MLTLLSLVEKIQRNTSEFIQTNMNVYDYVNIYEKKDRWKIWLLVYAVLIIAISLLYTNLLALKLANEERKKVELLANTYKIMRKIPTTGGTPSEWALINNVIANNTTIPVILTNEQGIIESTKNVDDNKTLRKDSLFFYKQLQSIKGKYPPLEIVSDFSEHRTQYPSDSLSFKDIKQFIYYDDSTLLFQLRIYPYIQFAIIGLFIFIAYLAFNNARKSEQNLVWLGMAKETAHQLGTPLSSLVAWLEILKDTQDPEGMTEMVGHEMEKDVQRLKLIADRFSKIGSKPELKENNIVALVEKTVQYAKRRASSRINFTFTAEPDHINAKVNTTLFDWVIENLLKNALDAMGGVGEISVEIYQENQYAVIEVTDSGKGIPKNKFSTVFQPGFSTKKRGWGLGLSLSKRIVEIYHKGKIFVSDSTIDEGTTFKVILPLHT